ncbi:MAG: helix-turn-helix domain-containing protein [Armatimonadetes bacterium]|nr:helix-turn-helix domain-containing protein [Armatimonadota bacterium]
MTRRPKTRATTEPGPVMTVAQVAAHLQLNRLTVYRYVREGRIPAARIGKVYRIFREDVDRFLEARLVGPGRSAPAPAKVVRPQSPQRPEEICVSPHVRGRPQPWDPATMPGSPVDWILRVLH